jgi:hypothetical protein
VIPSLAALFEHLVPFTTKRVGASDDDIATNKTIMTCSVAPISPDNMYLYFTDEIAFIADYLVEGLVLGQS